MSDTGLGAGGAVVLVLLGVGAGVIFSPSPVPHTEIVRVPQVVTEEAAPPEIEIQTESLPESCTQVLDYAQQVEAAANNLHNRSKMMYDRLNAVDTQMLDSNTASADFEEWLYHQNGRNSDALHAVFQANVDMSQALDQCEADVQASDDGEDVDRSQ